MIITDRPQLFIGGTWQDPRGSEVTEVRNPATGARLATAALACAADMDAAVRGARASFDARPWARAAPHRPADRDGAVRGARASFDAGLWARTPPHERAAVLHRAADLLDKR